MSYIDTVYDSQNAKVIIVPNQIIDLNLTYSYDLQGL